MFDSSKWKRRKSIIIFGADMSSSVDIDNKNKHILIIGDEETRRLDDTTLKAEAKHFINFKSTL